MALEVITKEDLQVFRHQLLNDIKLLLDTAPPKADDDWQGYKLKEVTKMFGCCYNTLMSLKRERKLRAKKLRGRWYFNKEDIHRVWKELFKQ